MSAQLALSPEQQAAFDQIHYPPNWNGKNSDYNPSPFPYYNSYTSPAWGHMPQVGMGGHVPSNQFNTALSQKVNGQEFPWSPDVSYVQKQKGKGRRMKGRGAIIGNDQFDRFGRPMAKRGKTIFKLQPWS